MKNILNWYSTYLSVSLRIFLHQHCSELVKLLTHACKEQIIIIIIVIFINLFSEINISVTVHRTFKRTVRNREKGQFCSKDIQGRYYSCYSKTITMVITFMYVWSEHCDNLKFSDSLTHKHMIAWCYAQCYCTCLYKCCHIFRNKYLNKAIYIS
jgi:hypothetical protein